MTGDYLQAYQSIFDYSEKINSTRITKVSYLLKLKAQRNSISDLDEKHKAWGQKEVMSKETSYEITLWEEKLITSIKHQ